jgi:hypothetical protein
MADKKYLLEYSPWLEAELTRRYKTSQTIVGKRNGRNTLSDAEGGIISSNEYNGYFKVIWNNVVNSKGEIVTFRVKVVNGNNPQEEFCGSSDLGQVKSATINVPADKTKNHLYLFWNREKTFFFDFENNVTELPDVMWWEIAAIFNGSIQQVWTGGVIYWGTRYWL